MADAATAWAAFPTTWRRAFVTFGVIVIYLAGTQIPLPGIDPAALGHLKGTVEIPVERVSIFALGVIPIFSALMIAEILKLVISPLARFEVGSRQNAARVQRFVQVTFLILAAFQSLGLANAFEQISGLADEPGPMFRAGVVMTLIASTALLGWLGDRVTLHGLCNGFWLLLLTPTLIKLPSMAAISVEYWQMGAVAGIDLLAAAVYFVLAIALLVVLARTRGVSAELSPAPASAPATGPGMSAAGVLDVWPPLLATYLGGLIAVGVALLLGADVDAINDTSFVAVRFALVAAMIALVIALRRRALPAASRPAYWSVALAQIAICIGGDVLTRYLRIPFAINGSWLIVAVALVMSALTRARGTRE